MSIINEIIALVDKLKDLNIEEKSVNKQMLENNKEMQKLCRLMIQQLDMAINAIDRALEYEKSKSF